MGQYGKSGDGLNIAENGLKKEQTSNVRDEYRWMEGLWKAWFCDHQRLEMFQSGSIISSFAVTLEQETSLLSQMFTSSQVKLN